MQAWLGKIFSPFNRQSRSATISETAAASPLASRDGHQSAGNTYLANGQLDAAEQCYRQAIAVDPEFAKAFCKLGFVLKEQGRQVDAEAALRQSAVFDPAIEDVWFMLADIAQANAKENDAATLLQRAISIDPQFEIAYSTLIQLLLSKQESSRVQALLKQALSYFPQSSQFHFLLANFRYEAGNFAESEAHLKASIVAQPDNGHAYANLAQALQRQNNDDAALNALNRTLRLLPENAECHMNHGIILAKLGRLHEAAAAFRRTISLNENNSRAYANLALTLQKQNDYGQALAAIDHALQLQSDNAEWHMTRGVILQKLDRPDDAVAAFLQAISLRHGYADALTNLGNLYQNQRKFELAESNYRAALACGSNSIELLTLLGTALQDQQRFGEAEQCYRCVLVSDPANVQVYALIGATCRGQGKYAEAIQFMELALRIEPDYAEGHFYRAGLLLTMGKFNEGWREYESRWLTPQMPTANTTRPLWLGEESLEGKTIWLHAEQGYGDTIQFIRYIEFVKSLGATVLVSVQEPLLELLRPVVGNSQISVTAPNTRYDFQCPLMSLPLACKTAIESIPARIPYLTAPPERVNHWATTRSIDSKLRVGLVWAGNAKHINDVRRSMPLRALLPLRAVKDTTLVCLQKVIPVDDQDTLTEFPKMFDVFPDLPDYTETAAIIANLDLVITVDTSVAHLTGALGKPVWIMLPFDPDFRWMLERTDSPWYPSATLFRQTATGNWGELVERVTAELLQFSQTGIDNTVTDEHNGNSVVANQMQAGS